MNAINKTSRDTALSPVMLLLDSSTSACSVALSQGGVIVEHICQDNAQGKHSSLLAPMVDQVLETACRQSLRLDAIVVSAGPGSYTGLRIASSLAKGLCSGLGLPLIAIPTLAMMASGYLSQQMSSSQAPLYIAPMIDARRMEVYTALFDQDGRRLSEDTAQILSREQFPYQAVEYSHFHLIGDGSAKTEGLWGQQHIVASDFVPEARYMLPLALVAYRESDFVDLAYWTPHYLKEYVAIVGKNKVLG